ncbi:hypothetical protein FF38_12689, partial [Lucilia cuprina]
MKSYQSWAIFVVLTIIPPSFSDNTDSTFLLGDEFRKDPSPQKQLVVYVVDNLSSISREYLDSSVKICHQVLNEDALLANGTSEVVEFKDNLKKFLQKYDVSDRNVETNFNLIGELAIILEKYFKMSEDNMTPVSKIILNILNEYRSDFENINNESVRKYTLLVDGFSDMFAQSKDHMGAQALVWFEKFKSFSKFSDRFRALLDYIVEIRINS